MNEIVAVELLAVRVVLHGFLPSFGNGSIFVSALVVPLKDDRDDG